jgi:general secretion pathway protein D
MYKILPFVLLALALCVFPSISFAETGVAEASSSFVPIAVSAQPDINVLYKEGIVLYKAGKINEAKEKFQSILDINPTYEPARGKLRLILDAEARMMRREKINSTREKVLEVENKWAPPPKKAFQREEKPQVVRFKSEQQKSMEDKAKQVIPEINFTDAHLSDVLQYLSRVSGVNIILDEDMFVKQKGEIGISVEEDTDKGVAAGPIVVSDRVSITLKSIPLIEALKYILSAKGLKYRIDEYAVIVSTPQRLAEVEMETRYYHLSSGIGSFTEYVQPAEGEEAAGEWDEDSGAKKESKLTVKDVLEQSGVPFPIGSKIFLDQRTGTLIIRNTPSNLAIIEDVLRILDVTPYQIEIEARFVQIKDETARELGLEWMITSGDFRFGPNGNMRWDSKTTDPVFGKYPDPDGITGNQGITRGLRYLSDAVGNPVGNILSLSGVLTTPEFKMILHALNQSGDANLVSAPKVTTLNNQRAMIKMVEEFIYPGEYELTPPTILTYKEVETYKEGTDLVLYNGKTLSSVVTPGIAVPQSFETRDLGILLNVTPSVGGDRKTITLTLIPEISEFVDWIDYGIKEGAGWNEIPIRKPIFQTRNVTTSAVINDGETVVLGGLVKEEFKNSEDKIPLLGDLPGVGSLFRSKTQVSEKTNLVIFVTARLLTPSGSVMKETKEYAY